MDQPSDSTRVKTLFTEAYRNVLSIIRPKLLVIFLSLAIKSFHVNLNLNLQAKAKIMVIRDIERNEIEFVSKTLNCLPIAHVDHMKPEKLGTADMVEEVEVRAKQTLLTFEGRGRTVRIDWHTIF